MEPQQPHLFELEEQQSAITSYPLRSWTRPPRPGSSTWRSSGTTANTPTW